MKIYLNLSFMSVFMIVNLISLTINGFSQNPSNQDIDANLDSNEKVSLFLDLTVESIIKNNVKSLDYLEEAFKLQQEIEDTSLVRLYDIAGQVYFHQNSYSRASEFFFKQLEIQNKVNPSKSHLIYNSIGNVYLRSGDIEKARIYYQKLIDTKDEAKYVVFSNLGILERGEGNYYKALTLMDKYKKIALSNNDTLAIIRASLNLSNIYKDLDEIEKGIYFLDTAIKLSKKANAKNSLVMAYINKGIYFYENQRVIDSATYYFTKSYEISDTLGFYYPKLDAAKWLVAVHEDRKDFEIANKYLKTYNEMFEKSTSDNDKKEISWIEKEYEFRRNQQNLAHKNIQQRLRLVIISLVLFSFVIILFLLFRMQKNRAKAKLLENVLLEEQLIGKNKELTRHVMQNLQITKTIDNIKNHVLEVKKLASGNVKKELNTVVRNLYNEESGLVWKEFDMLFLETHEDFYSKLFKDFPTLTQNEVRLCAFFRMNLNTKEISAITKQSINSIIVARSRLRKKLSISDRQENLSQFLFKY